MRERKEGRRGLECHFALFRNRPLYGQLIGANELPISAYASHHPVEVQAASFFMSCYAPPVKRHLSASNGVELLAFGIAGEGQGIHL